LQKNTTNRVYVVVVNVLFSHWFFIGYWILKRGRISIQAPFFIFTIPHY
jgi:hypothetical protein